MAEKSQDSDKVNVDMLTPREREVLTLIGEGYTLLEISQKLHRSLKTIESHRLSLGRKLSASNRVELAKIAIALGLVTLAGQKPSDEQRKAEQDLRWLEAVNSAIHNAVGPDLLQRFCIAASSLPEIDIAAICVATHNGCNDPDPDGYRRFDFAIASNGKLDRSTEYSAIKTPCEGILKTGTLSVPRNIQDAYPNDPWLKQVNAQGFVGMTLVDAENQHLGGVKLLTQQPIADTAPIERLLAFFAPRLAGALHVTKELDQLRAERDLLESERLALSPGELAAAGHTFEGSSAEALAMIMRRVQTLAGASFLRGIVEAFVDTFDLSHAALCVHDPTYAEQTLRAVIFVIDGRHYDNFVYQTIHTPCKVVLDQGQHYVAKNAGKLFPMDKMLLEHEVESYVGVRLPVPSEERTIGLFWMAKREAMAHAEAIQRIAKYYAPRIGAELENHVRMESLLQSLEDRE